MYERRHDPASMPHPQLRCSHQAHADRGQDYAADEKRRLQSQGLLIVAAGLLLGAHFGSWVTCLENTSLTHSLLVASTPPIIIALWTWIMRKPISAGAALDADALDLSAMPLRDAGGLC